MTAGTSAVEAAIAARTALLREVAADRLLIGLALCQLATERPGVAGMPLLATTRGLAESAGAHFALAGERDPAIDASLGALRDRSGPFVCRTMFRGDRP